MVNLDSKTNWEDITENGGIKIIFSDKANAQRLIRKIKPHILKEINELNLGSEEEKRAKNLVIEGDNLKVMASLYQYSNKVDFIIADPPYNTGKDFMYNDNELKIPNDPGLEKLVEVNDPSRHTKWMKFMLPRLQLMKQMLKPSGVLAICIDERELARLLPMLNEMFGENNRLAIINWQKMYAPKSNSKHVSSATEYVLVYAKKLERSTTNRLERTDKQDKKYSNPDGDPAGFWRASDASVVTSSKTGVYAIQNPFTGQLFYPPSARGWGIKKLEIKSLLEEWGSKYEERELDDGYSPALVLKGAKDPRKTTEPLNDPIVKKSSEKAYKVYQRGSWPKLIFLKEGKGQLALKRYLKDVSGVVPTTYWANEEFEPPNIGSISLPFQVSGHSQAGARELNAIIGHSDDKFIGVKPLKLFTKIIQLWCPLGGLVMDPFAGSGTTGHAILQSNKEVKETKSRERERERNFILIEPGRPEKGSPYCRAILQKRLKAVITGQWADGKHHEPLGGGFRFFELTKQVDSYTILQMERKELIETILSSHLNYIPILNNTYLIAKNSQNEGIYLVWSNNSDKITEDIYCQCVLEQKKHNLVESIYHIYARSITYQSSTINFQKIPEKVLIDFGIDPNTDAFVNKEEQQ